MHKHESEWLKERFAESFFQRVALWNFPRKSKKKPNETLEESVRKLIQKKMERDISTLKEALVLFGGEYK